MNDPMSYWANQAPDDLVGDLYKRVANYYSQLQSNGHYEKIRKAYNQYYGLGEYDSTVVHESGEQGELLRVRINKLRAILNHVLVLVTQNRPALKAVAVNSDVASLMGAKLGETLIDYYMSTRDIEAILKHAAELALVTSRGYVVMDWDPSQGNEYGATADGQVVYDGDVLARAKSALDVAYDIYSEDPVWYVVIDRVNKYDLAAQYPEKAEKIVQLQDSTYDQIDFPFFDHMENDLIYRYQLRHKRTPAVPQGRLLEFLDGEIWLTDGPLPYKDMLVFPTQPGKVGGLSLGYTPAFDLLSVGDVYNSVLSAIVTNVDTFGVNNVWTPAGSNLQINQLAGGLNHLESDVKPEAVNLSQMPPEMFNVVNMVDEIFANLSGINEVVQGTPQASLRSGEALALVAAQAVAYNSGLQQSYVNLAIRVGDGILGLLKEYATTPRLIAIVGQKNRSMARTFSGANLEGIDRVIVEPVNAVTKTTAGKMEIANQLLQQGLIKSPEEYLTLLQTGRPDSMLDGVVTESLLIQQENEFLRDGAMPVMAVLTDDHARHIKGHKEVLSDPYLRTDPAVVERTLAHIQEHINLGTSPMYMQIAPLLMEQPIQPMMGPPGASPMAPGQPPMAEPMPAMPEETPPEMIDAGAQIPSEVPQ
jgi:hypothetical protein